MASILLISNEGDGVPIALRLAQEGHIVKVWFKERKATRSMRGFKNPSQVGDPRKIIDQYDLVITDMVGNGKLMEWFKDKGKVVLGGCEFSDKIELDRDYGGKVINSLTKLKIPDNKLCQTTNDLIREIKSRKEPQVIKPLGNKSTSLTLVSSDDSNRTLLSYVEAMGDDLTPCLIQDRIDGIEISTEGWFDGRDWVLPFNHTIEKKRFMEGDKGPNTGCMGNVVWTTGVDKLVEYGLIPLKPLLERVGYVGPIDINCIVTKDAAYFLEFTARFGYDAIQAYSELVKMDMFSFLYSIATRSRKSIPVYSGEYAIAVRLSVPPWPMKSDGVDDLSGVKFVDIEAPAMKHVWLSDVMLDKDELPVLAGVDGVIGCVTARGNSVRECRRRVYRTIGNIVIHNDVQYRNDIGVDVDEKIDKLKEWGWLES